MSQSVVFNNTSYLIPNTGDVNWGDNVTSYLVAIAAGAFQLSGGSFFLTAEANFGPSFGLASLYYKSRTANLASAGVLRLAKTDTIDWRNNANSANLVLGIDGSDNLTFNGAVIPTGGSTFVSSITGTANQVIASSPTGAVTLSLPQNIDTGASPTLAGLTLSGLTASLPVLTNGSKALVSGQINLAAQVTGNLPVANLNGGSGAISTTYWAGNGVWSTPTGSGTVNAGTAGQVAYYATSTTAVSGNPILSVDSSSLRVTVNSVGVPADIVAVSGTSAASRLALQNSNTSTWNYQLIGDATSVRLRDSNNTQDVLTYTHSSNLLSTTESLVVGEGTTGSNARSVTINSGSSGATLASLNFQRNSVASGNINSDSNGVVINAISGSSVFTSVNGVALSTQDSAKLTLNTPIVFNPTTSGITGTTTNNSASAGIVGEYVESVVGPVAYGASAVFGDATTISLTAGDWDVTLVSLISPSVALGAIGDHGISTTAGNSTTGLVLGSNRLQQDAPSNGDNAIIVIPSYRMSLSGTTTVRAKFAATYAGATPNFYGRLSARRVR